MAAPKKNNNAERWTLESAKMFANDVYDYVRNHDNCTSMSKACTELDEYENVIQYLENKFNVEFESIKKAKDILKARLIEQGLYNKANATMAIFILKNNHDMSDKVDTNNKTELSGSLETKTTITFTKGSK